MKESKRLGRILFPIRRLAPKPDARGPSRPPSSVGVKYAFRTATGGRLAVIIHNDGQREIYYRHAERRRARPSSSSTTTSTAAGSGDRRAYERPKIVEELELALGELQIEWIDVPDTSPGSSGLAELGLRAKTGVTVIAILREPEPVSGAAGDVIQQGDTLVAVGKAGQFAEFRRLLAHGPFRP